MSGSSQHDVRSNIRMAFVSEEHIKKSALNRGQKITRTQDVFGVTNRSNNISIELPSDGHHNKASSPNIVRCEGRSLVYYSIIPAYFISSSLAANRTVMPSTKVYTVIILGITI